MSAVNQLTPAEEERLGLITEEMGESLQIIGKIQRHGFESSHPDYGNISNRHLLAKEIGHVQARIDLMISRGDISQTEVQFYREAKHTQVPNYLHYQKER